MAGENQTTGVIWIVLMMVMLIIGALAPGKIIKIACAIVIVLILLTVMGFLPPGGIK